MIAMAGREIWCRYADCGVQHTVLMGRFPDACPACKRDARWSTMPPIAYPDPLAPYDVNRNDARFLRSIKIDPEMP